MKKLLFALFVLVAITGSISMHAQSFSMAAEEEREIPLVPVGSKEGGPTARSIISLPANAFINSNVLSIVFNEDIPSVRVSVTNASTGAKVYSETHFSPELITIDLSSEDAGEFILEIESVSISLSGDFAF